MADTWTMLSGYTASDYVDTMVFEVVSATKKIRPLSGQTLVAGEKNSQYVRFEMDRFWDGIDISPKSFSITYSLAGKYYGTSEAVSAEVSTDKLRFGWIVPEEACCIAGTLMFVLVIKSDGYVLKTQIAETPVVKSLDEESVVPEPTREAWYREFQARVQEDLNASSAALTSAQDALTRANTANDAASSALTAASEANLAAQDAIVVAKEKYGSPLVANAGPEMVDTNRVYVFTGSESAYTYGHWYYYDNGVWNDGGVYNGEGVATDSTLSVENMPADAKATGDKIDDEIDALKEVLQDISTKAFPSTAKVLLISLLQNAVFTSDQTEIIDALDTALNIGDITAVTGISLDSSAKTVTAGDTVTITATVTPSNATNKGIVWTSSDETVATVSGGIVTGVGNGTAVITAKTVDGGFTATCSVTSTVVNLLDRSKSSVSNYVNRDNGQLASSGTFDATDFIWLEPNKTYYSEGCYLKNFYAFYNANKTYVSSPPASVTITSEPDRNWGADRKGTIVTGSQGYYFRGSYNKSVAYTPYIALAPIE